MSLQVAQMTLTLTAEEDGDLVLSIKTPDDDETPYITRLGMLTMAQQIIGDLE